MMTIEPATTAASSCETEGPGIGQSTFWGTEYQKVTIRVLLQPGRIAEARLKRTLSVTARAASVHQVAHTLVRLDIAACLRAVSVNHDGIL